jgi:large subunit ribosomal protein L19|tara:strand:- start:1006 stop:1344 length:339 start_codon:yes stop_codon:yes gene_type:complete
MNKHSLEKIAITTNPHLVDVRPGDQIRISYRIVEGDRERLQPFEGIVIKRRNGKDGSITVRRIASGVGVERTIPLQSNRVEKLELIQRGKVRRSKLYFLRGRTGKSARLKQK